jgi:hypothetical protein
MTHGSTLLQTSFQHSCGARLEYFCKNYYNISTLDLISSMVVFTPHYSLRYSLSAPLQNVSHTLQNSRVAFVKRLCKNSLNILLTISCHIKFNRYHNHCWYPKTHTLKSRCNLTFITRIWVLGYKSSNSHYDLFKWLLQSSLTGSQHWHSCNFVRQHCLQDWQLQIQLCKTKYRLYSKNFSSSFAMLKFASPVVDNVAVLASAIIILALDIASFGNILGNHNPKLFNMSCPLNQTKSTQFV